MTFILNLFCMFGMLSILIAVLKDCYYYYKYAHRAEAEGVNPWSEIFFSMPGHRLKGYYEAKDKFDVRNDV